MNDNLFNFDTGTGRVLLVVDRNRMIHQKVRQAFYDCFDRIFSAGTVAEADMILRKIPATHLLCELHMESINDGCALTARWRKAYPSISRICIFSGCQIDASRLPDHVDAFFLKGDLRHRLKSMLLATEIDTEASSIRTEAY